MTSSTHLKERDSQVQPFMPERDSSESRLTSPHLGDKLGGVKIRSNSVPNGLSIPQEESKAPLYPPPERRGFTGFLVNNIKSSKINL